MTDKQAKLILQAYKPGVSSTTGSEFASALDHIRQQPELEAWFQEEQARDQALSRKLHQSPVPDGLLDSILNGPPPPQQKPSPAVSWRPWAMAASILFLLSISAWLGRGFIVGHPTEFVSLQRDMAEFLVEFPQLDIESERLFEIKNWLHSNPGLAKAEVPPSLSRFPGIGCRTIPWEGKKIALVCFTVEGEIVHLIMFRSDQIEGVPQDDSPTLDRLGRWTTASWSQEGITYVALTQGGETFAERLITDG